MKPADQFNPKNPAAGTYAGVPHQDYLDAPGVSVSMLKHLHPTPAHLKAYLVEKEDEQPSMAMQLGTMIHLAILEPENPWPDIACKPDGMTFATREGKAWRAEQQTAGKMILTQKDYDTITGCARAAAVHPLVQEAMSRGQPEVSIFSEFHACGVTLLRKARIDWLPPGNALVDIKTVEDASPEAIARKIVDLRWHSQAAHYLDVWNTEHPDEPKDVFLFLVIEKPTRMIAPLRLSLEFIGAGRALNIDDLNAYAQCLRDDRWPGYPWNPIPILQLPKWAKKFGDHGELATILEATGA